MAKASRFPPRNRKTPGFATGQVVCRIRLPELDEAFDLKFNFAHHDGVHAGKLTKLRRFVREQLPRTEASLDGAIVVIAASVRKTNGALGWKQLAKWQAGQSLAAFFDDADQAWLRMPKEEGWKAVEVDVPRPRRP